MRRAMDELTFIKWIKDHLECGGTTEAVTQGIGDDMAVLTVGRQTVLLGSDMLVEGVHFDLGRTTPEQVGHKALGVCLSDCAAMAAKPVAAVVSFAKAKTHSVTVVEGIYRGLAQTAKTFDCPVVGGDSCGGSKDLVIDVAVLAVPDGITPVLRGGARVGDTLYVTGPLGGSILGRHVAFTPCISQARYLASHLPVHAMIDISDGLSTDLCHMCRASGCGAEIERDLLSGVISPAAVERSKSTAREPLEHALHDGEDFELLLAVGMTPEHLPTLPQDVVLLPVGQVTDGNTVCIIDAAGVRVELPEKGYRHF